MSKYPTTPDAPRFTLGGDEAGRPDTDDPALWEGTVMRRFLAYLVDVLILGVIGLTLWVVTFLTLGLLAPVTALLWAVAPLAYHTFLVSQRGATVGQKWTGIQVVDVMSGGRPTVIQAFVLTCLFYLSVMLSFIPLIYVLFDSQARFLHDLFSGTRALKAERLRQIDG
jgi:uncharacterized RDD family membrane protein YckC